MPRQKKDEALESFNDETEKKGIKSLPMNPEKNKEYPLFTFTMGANGSTVTLRSDNYLEIEDNIPRCKEILLKVSNEVRTENTEAIIAKPTPIPEWALSLKPESCKVCKSTNLTYVTGGTKTNGTFYAFDCLDCKSSVKGRELPTRHFINPPVNEKKPEKMPEVETPVRTDSKEGVKCETCKADLNFGVIKYCEKTRADKTPKYLCYNCQKKEK